MEIIRVLIRRTKHFLVNPAFMLGKLCLRIIPTRFIPDWLYLKVAFHNAMGYSLNLRHPKTFNEKLQWLKLYDRNPLYTTLVDKYRVKQWVADKIGEQYVIPTLAVYQSVDEIDLDKLPNQFVLKCNHDSGSVVICRDKATFNIGAAKEKLSNALAQNYYYNAREWPYKNVKKCILAEKYIRDNAISFICNALVDYKFFCFNGEPTFMYIGADKSKHPTSDFFDMEFNHLPIRMLDPNAETPPQKPKEFEELKRLATILCQGIPHIRVDFYVNNGHIYFGEMTFFHMGGFTEIKPKEWNLKIGEMIKKF